MPTVLLVDDAEDIREIAQIAFAMSGWSCVTAESGSAAAAALQNTRPDLVLLDYDLGPSENGLEVLQRLQGQLGCTPVVFLTASRDTSGYMAAGAAGVISKPFDPMAIADLAARFLR